MTGRPGPERAGDVVPGPAEFAGWPPRGVLSAVLRVGPVDILLERIDRDVQESLERWAAPALARPGGGPSMRLEALRSGRERYLESRPGDRLRLQAWREGTGAAMVTHQAGLLLDERVERGFLLLTPQSPDELDRSLQNAVRVALQWHLLSVGRGFLVHAAAVAAGSRAILLLGPSGSGKSTLARLARPRAVLADDVAVVTRESAREADWVVHPGPLWAEPRFPGARTSGEALPVAALLRLARDARTATSRLSRVRAAAAVASCIPFQEGLPPAAPVTELAGSLASAVRAATFAFAPDATAWPVAEAWLGTD